MAIERYDQGPMCYMDRDAAVSEKAHGFYKGTDIQCHLKVQGWIFVRKDLGRKESYSWV